jgi:hypothetical protein
MPQWFMRRGPTILQTQAHSGLGLSGRAATIELMLRDVSGAHDREKLTGIFLDPEGHWRSRAGSTFSFES